MPKSDFTSSGSECIHYGQIYTHFQTWTTTTVSHVSLETAESLAKAMPGDVIFTNTSENLSDVCKAVAWVGEYPIAIGGHSTALHHNENPKYIAYCTQTRDFQHQKRRLAFGTKVVEVTPERLAKIAIPWRPRWEQDAVVNVLERCEASTKAMAIEIKAEIILRRKQYEYYRDRLLTFKEAA